jgi:large subunit ribosomal protein L6
MSRIGKKVIDIPEKTEITVTGSHISVKGPKGNLEKSYLLMILR